MDDDDDETTVPLSRTTSMETVDSIRTEVSLRGEGITPQTIIGSSVKEHNIASVELAK